MAHSVPTQICHHGPGLCLPNFFTGQKRQFSAKFGEDSQFAAYYSTTQTNV